MFDIFYIGENIKLADDFPFAKQVSKHDQIKPNTKMYWVIEPNIEITDTDVLSYRPEAHDTIYEHVWKWDTSNYGGLRLLPKKESKGVKEINKVVCKKSFEKLNTKTPGKYFDKNPYASHVWCIDKDYKLSEDINWAPSNFEPNFIHSFHLRGQLEHKYPDKEGGIKLYPREWKSADTKYHNFLDAKLNYPIMFVRDIEDYSQRNTFADEYVWLIDSGHKVNHKTFDWVPSPFEDRMIHSFKMPYQLQEKFPGEMGGIRLVPKRWKDAETKIHKECPIEDENYDVFYTNKKFDADTFDFYAKRSETEWFWVVDRDYDFNGKLLYVPATYERDYIHVFKLPGFLEYRYYISITELWDERVSGIYLVSKNFDNTKRKLHIEENPVKYDVFFTDNLNDYNTFARKSRTDMFWLIDDKRKVDPNIRWLPKEEEQKYINEFTDGMKLIPKNFEDAIVKTHGSIKSFGREEYEKFTNEEEGRKNTKLDWFWVVDNDVEVLEDFEFDYIPDEWDKGKTHVWQKLNPVTKRQYDYGGVTLYPKVKQTKGRPKYIREPSCVQQEYPVYYLQASDYENGLQSVYERLSAQSDSKMYWVVDAFTRLDPDFKFSYYPTQWDQEYIHVFLNEDNAHTSVRLVPKELFTTEQYTDKDIENNSFEPLKLINTIASLRPKWPVIHLQSLEKNEFINAIKDIETPFVWTVDPDVKVDQKLLDSGYLPAITNTNKVHAWQKLNPLTKKVHAYGGVRLWPTNKDYTDIKSDDLRLNRIKNIQYVKEVGSTTKAFDVVYLSYKEPFADKGFNKLQDHIRSNSNIGLIWIRDVKGIFEAHKVAASRVNTKMFWVVDADAEIDKEFNFDYIPDVYDQEVVHVWASKNPITQDEYGYGGVKLFPTEMVRNATSWGLDFTTGLSSRFKSMPQVSCITRFNTDAFSTWRSAFRECVKLTLNDDAESKQRLDTWINTRGTEAFTDEAVKGALEGNTFAKTNKNNLAELDKINDFGWLREQYDKS
jgi:hypothetical protein